MGLRGTRHMLTSTHLACQLPRAAGTRSRTKEMRPGHLFLRGFVLALRKQLIEKKEQLSSVAKTIRLFLFFGVVTATLRSAPASSSPVDLFREVKGIIGRSLAM